jgi:hypothetical protein
MMRPDPHFLDDIAKVAGGAVNVLSGLRQQIESEIKIRVEEMASRMDLVPREDLERVEAQLARLQKDHKDILARLDKLEGGSVKKTASSGGGSKKATPAPAKKAAPKAAKKTAQKPSKPAKAAKRK